MTLVPEQRADKNGHLVTRWVKPDEGSVSTSSIPPVSLPTELPFDRVDYITELLNFWGEHCSEDFTRDEISNLFWEMDDSTLLAIDTDYQLDSGYGERMRTIYDWVGYFAEEQEEYFRELVTYAGAFADDRSANFIEESIALLRNSGALPPMDDYSQAGLDLEQGIRNILSITETVFGDDYTSGTEDEDHKFPVLPNELISLIMTRPNDTERIKQIVTTRDTLDADLVQSVLDTEAPAVSAGIL